MLSVRIEPRAGQALRQGHPWVYSNHVREVEGSPTPGDVVRVKQGPAGTERDLGTAFYHPNSLIALRHLSFEGELPDRAFLAARLGAARSLRARLAPDATAFRLCHGEADGLPGLVVDRHGDVLVVQAHSAGMNRLLADVTAILMEEHGARCVVERNESSQREAEGLPVRRGILAGELPEVVEISLPPLRLIVEPLAGQKTGAFLDQSATRVAVAPFARGQHVYDGCCNSGAFSVHAALEGALSVVGVDSSADVIRLAERNAALNGVSERCAFQVRDVREDMDERHRRRERFGLVLLDPPSFTQSRKHVPAAKRALRELNQRAMTLVEPGGILVTSCCSYHIRRDTFVELVAEAALGADRRMAVLDVRGAAPDHPVLASMPEAAYLKCVVACIR